MNPHLPAAGDAPKTFSARFIEKMASLLSQKKALEYLGLFAMLTVIYYCYFVRDAKLNATSPIIDVTPGLAVLMLKFLILTGWPFTLLALYDPTWRSKDAGNVFLLSWIATNVLWYHQTGCAFCVFAASFHIIPYVLCAWIAHGFGVLYCRTHRDEV